MIKKTMLVAALLAAPSLAQYCVHINNTPPGTDLLMGDDTTQIIALPFAFPFNGTNYNVITVASNGYVWFGINTSSDFSDSEAEFLAQGPRIAVFWDDWQPNATSLPAGGGVFYNESAITAHVVWKDVPHYYNSTTEFANMELVLSITGEIVLHYETLHSPSTSTGIVGLTAGNNVAANALDLTALAGSATPIIAGATGYELFAAGTNDLSGTSWLLTPTNPTDYVLTSTTVTNCPLTPGPTIPTYNYATSSSYGAGCPSPTSGTWFEEFANGTIDLSNTSHLFVASGGNTYVATPGTGFDTGYTAADILVQGDDTQVNCPLTAMGGFPFMGATLTSVDTCSNGFIWMTPNTNNDFSATAAEFASQSPRLAPCWSDWNFNQGGTGLGGTFYWTATTTHCMATWENVAAFGQTGTMNTFQCKLYPNGNIEYSYGTVLNNSTTGSGVALVGLSGGNSTPLPPVDVSAPGANVLVDLTPATANPLDHTSTLAHLGGTYDMTTSNFPAGAVIGATLVGLSQMNFDLGPLGAPGCFQYAPNTAVFLHISPSGSFTDSMPIPLNLAFHGLNIASQGAVYVPGINPLGVVSSNGRLGTMGL
ncbi:MAG: hypothetical protein KDC98_25200 [Planctomycetes bacterium]|nr:hypothetical protein [Planctomycetota bacterium]